MSRALLLAGLLGAGCQPATSHPDARVKDAFKPPEPPPWWTPAPGEVDLWDIQLAAPYDLSATRVAYVLNLFDLIPADTELTYADGSKVTFPKGALSEAISSLHAQRPRTVIICRVDTGAIALTDPDASKFPGYAANPPDDPTPPAMGSVIGWSTTLPAGMRWLDVRPAAYATVLPLIEKRLELAKTIGCDAVLPDHNDMFAVKRANGMGAAGEGTGFSPPLIPDEEIAWFVTLAGKLHADDRELSVGFRGSSLFGGAQDLPLAADWVLADRCGESDDCENWDPFLRAGKAVLALEIDHVVENRGPGQFCLAQLGATITDGIVKDEALTSAHWDDCPNPSTTDAGAL